MNLKGFSSPEAKAAGDRARVLIEEAEALGEPPENPLILYSVLYVAWLTNAGAFNGDALRTLAAQILALAEKEGAPVPTMMGHLIVAYSALATGNPAQGRRHCDHSIALHDPAYRPLTALFATDGRILGLGMRSHALWFLGYPEDALADANQSLEEARDLGHSAILFLTLNYSIVIHFLCGDYAATEARANELFTLADEQESSAMWKPAGLLYRGWSFAGNGRTSEAIQLITSGLAAYRSSGATNLTPVGLSLLAKCYADLGQLEEAWRTIDEAKAVIERTGETWFEAYVHCIAGEIALKSQRPDAAKAEVCFEQALAVARQQQAKSWELRAATSMARLWRDQGKPQQARELLAPIYDWFTEGFNTRDLKEAKALLDKLHV